MQPWIRQIVIVLVITLLLGCSTVVQVAAGKYPAVPVSHVQILLEEPSRPYEVVALINHTAVWMGSAHGEIQKARELAAKAGADALVISNARNDTFWDNANAAGKAIRWKHR